MPMKMPKRWARLLARHLSLQGAIWVWVKIKAPGNGRQVVVYFSTYQGKPFWVHIFDPPPFISQGRKPGGKTQYLA